MTDVQGTAARSGSPAIVPFTVYKVRWIGDEPQVWAYTAFGRADQGVRGHTFVGVARRPQDYVTHVGRQ